MMPLAFFVPAVIVLIFFQRIYAASAGRPLSRTKRVVLTACNCLLVALYLDILMHDRYLFIFQCPQIAQTHESITWATMMLVCLHTCFIPLKQDDSL